MLKVILHKTLTLLSWLLIVFGLKAQSFYKFTVTNEPYTELNGATLLSNSFTNASFLLPLSKPLKAFDQTTGNDLIVGKNAFIVSTGTDYSFAFDPLVMSLSKLDNTSSLSYTISPISNDTVVTIQWKNMKLDSGSTGDFINIQCRIYYHSQTVEFHYGPSQALSPRFSDGSLDNLIGVFLLSQDFNTAYDYNWVFGQAATPSVSHNPQQLVKLIGLPANGTIYRFTRKSITGIENPVENMFTLYPNPALNTVFVFSPDNSPEKVTITNSTGKTVLTAGGNETTQGIDISSLPAGIYFISYENQNGQNTQKLIKQ